MTLTRQEVRRLLDDHGLRPSRARGQNFVVDPNTVRRIARLAGVGPGDQVVEVGAGLGCLTLALAETGASITAIEVDRGLVPLLRAVVSANETAAMCIDIVEADAMKLDWIEVLGSGQWVLVANLPYNIATPLIADLLDDVPAIERMLVMVQREVGDRLVAGPGREAFGAVSVKVDYWATARVVGRVPAQVFMPVPNVESALVEIRRRVTPAIAGPHDRDRMFELVHAGFSARRKMLRRALALLVDAEGFARAGVRPEARAEELDVAAWARLAAYSPRPKLSGDGVNPVGPVGQ